ncbi:MAG: efflux RND transporter periplasmic adaptor subunit [Sulfurovum sp.]|nr:efflux RND transporter periplasmic adaptor subunit [Sulfurovum sp.]
MLRMLLPVLFSALFFLGCNNEKTAQQTTAQNTPPEVNVHTLTKSQYPIWIRFTGKTQAVDEVDVISRVKGELKSQHFQAGQQVHTGDLLFTIDKSEYQSAWDRANAMLQKDKASYALAKANVKRYTPLVREQLAPREKLDELTATLKQLEATIKADEAALEKARINLNFCEIKASINGRIGKALILTGNTVNIGDKLAKIVQTDKLYVNFNPSAREVALIRRFAKSDHLEVRVGIKGDTAQTAELKGKVDFIDNISDPSTGTVAMRAVVDNPQGLIYPGSFVEVALFLGDYKVLAVHPNQISLDQQGEYLYTLDANNTVHKSYIHPLFANNDLVVIDKGVKPGTRVLVEIPNALADGNKVTPIEVDNPIKTGK